jgi:hypothetical protein
MLTKYQHHPTPGLPTNLLPAGATPACLAWKFTDCQTPEFEKVIS